MRFFSALRVLAAVGLILGTGHVLMQQLVTPQDRIYAFVYQRGVVQILMPEDKLQILYIFGRVSQFKEQVPCDTEYEFRGCADQFPEFSIGDDQNPA